jgi:dynein heavy chain 1
LTAQAEGESDKAIAAASKTGKWVMLKNVHLAADYLVRLEKKLLSSTPHAAFRIFLTTEINPKLPVSLLQASRVFVFEPAAGVKANLMRTLQSFPDSMSKNPAERSRMYFLLAWMHAVVQERLRYVPVGWSKKYEFGEPDLRSAIETIDTWVDDVAGGK